MNNKKNIKDILFQFDIDTYAEPFGNGHINDTYLVKGSQSYYVLQKINKNVFPEPRKVMDNIDLVLKHVKKKLEENAGSPDRETMQLIPTKDGKTCYAAPDGEYYRLYTYVTDTYAIDRAETPDIFAQSAHAFGRFQKMLADFPAEKLYEVIPKFHDTPDRLRQFEEAVEKNAAGRRDQVAAEIAFVRDRAHLVSRVTDAIAAGTVPLRVTHNDTKLNNVLFDTITHEAICVVDLDTVMPGSVLYDFGDALRFGASTGDEDEKDLDKILFDLSYFEAFTKAYLEELGSVLTPTERELLPFSALLLTLECGIRFLTDYLNGDVYFRVHREEHNLDRARTQFKLVADMERKMPQMEAIAKKY